MASQEKNCYIGVKGKKYGPLSEADILKLFNSKKINSDVNFARPGAKGWIPLSQSGIIPHKMLNVDDGLPPLPQMMKPQDRQNDTSQTVTSDEIVKAYFATSLLYFWVKGSLEVDEHFVKTGLRNSILLGLVPAGADNSSIPLDNISTVNVSSSYHISEIIGGIIISLIALVFLFISLVNLSLIGIVISILVILFGIGVFDDGIQIHLNINKHADTTMLRVPFFEKENLIAFSKHIEAAIRKNMDNRNVAKATEKQTVQQLEVLSKIADSLPPKN